MSSIFKAFLSLQDHESGGFQVHDLPYMPIHKIGRSDEGFPMFFILNEQSFNKIVDKSLAMIHVQYNKECLLYRNDQQSSGNYTVITLRSADIEIQAYFIEIIWLALQKLPAVPSVEDIRTQINSIVGLFSRFSGLPKKAIQGVWAELVLIESGRDVDYLVNSWHSSVYSKFDFNDGTDKIEVKSTLRDRRIHKFSLSQLLKNASSNLTIASIMTAETGIGTNIFDLREMILLKLSDKNLIGCVDEMLAMTLGKDIERAGECFFDLSMARDSMLFYSSDSVPAIHSEIPIEITNISFDCDLSGIEPTSYQSENSRLFQSISQ
jgi:hypothetical protein